MSAKPQIPTAGRKFVKANVIAEMLSLTDRAVYDLRKKGVLPGYTFGGSVRFVVEEVLDSIRCSKEPKHEENEDNE